MRPPIRIETKRLILRRPKLSDAQGVFAYASDPETVRYLAFKRHCSLKEAEIFLEGCLENWKKNKEAVYSICLKNSHEYMGGISISGFCSFKPGFGYVLSKQYWGKGYMSEALNALVDWAWAQPHIHRAWAFCDVDNPASARVMEKAGMKREGVFKQWMVHPNISDDPRDCLVYAKTK